MNTNEQTTFHSTEEATQKMEEDRQKIAEHVSKHYRKYLFGIGMICGFTISIISVIVFGVNTSKADFEPTPDVQTIAIFNQMNALAHEKDEFFHQEGKIYSLSGDSLFKKYDNMYHILDNNYHRAVTIDEKIQAAKKLVKFFTLQDELFDATTYNHPEKDKIFDDLKHEFDKTIQQLTEKTIAETIENTTGDRINKTHIATKTENK